MSIQIGNYYASGPMDQNNLPEKSGVYIILGRPPIRKDVVDSEGLEWDVIYVGQSNNVHRRVTVDHQQEGGKAECWEDKNYDDIKVAVIEEDNEDNRRDIESELIEKFNPPCND